MDAKNVLGGQLLACSYDPVTGYFRDGCCNTDSTDRGNHTICARVTADFLAYARERGNDLMTPMPGDRWCVCATRWQEALEAGVAPPVVLEATHERALRVVPLEILMEYAWESGSARD
jgi:uncharacterized protein (DUF2237 family)